MADLLHDHEVLVEVLVYHQRKDISGCHCGWGELGRSYAEHVASVVEDSLRVRQDPSPADQIVWCPSCGDESPQSEAHTCPPGTVPYEDAES